MSDSVMRHIDSYTAGPVGSTWEQHDPCRLYEGDEAEEYASWHPLPYFNGYTLLTDIHAGGDCEKHRPTGQVWAPFTGDGGDTSEEPAS